MVDFRPVAEHWHCLSCGVKNYGGEHASLFLVEAGRENYVHSICLCDQCGRNLAGVIATGTEKTDEKKEIVVVRCRECIHGRFKHQDMYECLHDAEIDEETGVAYGFIDYHEPDFFCGYGESKEAPDAENKD